MNYDKKKYKELTWKNPMILHWILNPGLAVNELILGQTIPKVMLIEKEGKIPYAQRSLIPCPHCGELHSPMKWSAQNKTAFKNWFGYYCDKCNNIIPVQRNLTSLLLLTITFPLWGWFRKSLKQNWLQKQPERYQNISLEIPIEKNTTKHWLKSGLSFSLFMFITMQILYPLITNEEITQKSILIGIPIWLIAGLSWGLIMKLFLNRKGKEDNSLNREIVK